MSDFIGNWREKRPTINSLLVAFTVTTGMHIDQVNKAVEFEHMYIVITHYYYYFWKLFIFVYKYFITKVLALFKHLNIACPSRRTFYNILPLLNKCIWKFWIDMQVFTVPFFVANFIVFFYV